VVEGGGPTAVDSYFVRLAEAPTHPVYVTVSLARSPQEEEDDTLVNPFPLHDGPGDSIWISKTPPAIMNNPLDSDFQRLVVINGVLTLIPNRAVVLVFDPRDWDQDQEVFIYAPDDDRSEGDRVVVSSIRSSRPTAPSTAWRCATSRWGARQRHPGHSSDSDRAGLVRSHDGPLSRIAARW
jgi:hypothetical protein